ncbi:hypothetical protein GGS23DRAFT_592838 [Durotheca rogersii]|uniref:uncharacterized protein n=1 Tax=Durotheca rogersii TaxID=419775 RepID=UPI00221ED644|nr:uncharacterized protein GGS23DRAFT_592838 [Durotheca rogersii]KAI5867531.1 hypothetical protein GGS23DRAFT_592838 [Durotheca rogersii]
MVSMSTARNLERFKAKPAGIILWVVIETYKDYVGRNREADYSSSLLGLVSGLHQFLCLGEPRSTEKDLLDLRGKAIFITGVNADLWKKIAWIIYSRNAKVYMMARSKARTRTAINTIRVTMLKCSGELIFIYLGLAGLTTMKCVECPEKGSKTAQGYELQLGVNCVGPFALTKLLTPMLMAAAAAPGNVRVAWKQSGGESVILRDFDERLPAITTSGGTLDRCGASELGNYPK